MRYGISFFVSVFNNSTIGTFIDDVKILQKFFDSNLRLLWINTPTFFKSDAESIADLYEFAQEFKLDKYSVNIRSDYKTEDGIFRFAKETNARRSQWELTNGEDSSIFFTGSIAEDIVNHVNFPIWTFSIQ